jgi:chorismate mutase / prephenate dehydratase
MPEATPPTLDALRVEIDKIDGKLHALLRARAEVVSHVAAAKALASGGAPSPAFRPGREASMMRRLIGNHKGPFPEQSLVRIWREIISGMTKMQEQIVVAAYRPEKDDAGGWDAARDHFGTAAQFLPMRRARDVIVAVRDGQAHIGVVPAPGQEDGEEPWWPAVAANDPDLPRIILKLPFARPASQPVEREYVAVALAGPEPEVADAIYLAVEAASGVSRERVADALKAAGVDSKPLLTAMATPGLYLAEVESGWAGAIEDTGIRHVMPIGGYPMPLDCD